MLSKSLVDSNKERLFFEQLYERHAFSNVMLVTTNWHEESAPEISARNYESMRELREDFWKSMIDVGASVERHDNTLESGQRLVLTLLRKKATLLTGHVKKVDKTRGKIRSFGRLSLVQSRLLDPCFMLRESSRYDDPEVVI